MAVLEQSLTLQHLLESWMYYWNGIILVNNKEKRKKIINKKKKKGIISYRCDYEYKEKKKQKWLNVKISVSPKAIDNLDMNTVP